MDRIGALKVSRFALVGVGVWALVVFSGFMASAPAGAACPSAGFRVGRSAGSPDCRAHEQASPVNEGVCESGYRQAGGAPLGQSVASGSSGPSGNLPRWVPVLVPVPVKKGSKKKRKKGHTRRHGRCVEKKGKGASKARKTNKKREARFLRFGMNRARGVHITLVASFALIVPPVGTGTAATPHWSAGSR